jgi:hypothetical protein
MKPSFRPCCRNAAMQASTGRLTACRLQYQYAIHDSLSTLSCTVPICWAGYAIEPPCRPYDFSRLLTELACICPAELVRNRQLTTCSEGSNRALAIGPPRLRFCERCFQVHRCWTFPMHPGRGSAPANASGKRAPVQAFCSKLSSTRSKFAEALNHTSAIMSQSFAKISRL